jgi:biopolymer transport protein ExbD
MEDGGHHGIDLAPMLDFVLNLLIFFIIITSFVKRTGVEVVQPNAQTAEQVESGNILIAVEPNGEIWMDRQQVSLPEIRAQIQRMHAIRPQDAVVITADKESQAGIVMKIVQQVREGGIETIAVAANQGAEG